MRTALGVELSREGMVFAPLGWEPLGVRKGFVRSWCTPAPETAPCAFSQWLLSCPRPPAHSPTLPARASMRTSPEIAPSLK